MIVVAVACLVLAVVAGIAWWRARQRVIALEAELRTRTDELAAARTDAADARAEAARTAIERDDALQRVQRARRDAADVANRLRDERAARTLAEEAVEKESQRRVGVETELATARSDLEAARAQVAEAQVHGASAPGAGTVAVLWSSTLARIDQIWRTSISLGLDDASPLDSSDDPLRTALEIVIGAAREESGADIDLHWATTGPVPPGPALVVLVLIESVVAVVAKSAGSTNVHVGTGDGHVDVRFDVVDDAGVPVSIEVPASLSDGAGQVRIPLAPATVDG